MNKILEKIAWKTRKWHFQIIPVRLEYKMNSFEFDLFLVELDLRAYRLFSFHFRLSNKTYVKTFTIEYWDLLFLRIPLFNLLEKLEDKRLYTLASMTKWEKLQLRLLKTIL